MDLWPPPLDNALDTRLARLLAGPLWLCVGAAIPYLLVVNLLGLGDIDSTNALVAVLSFVIALVLLYRGRLQPAALVATVGLMSANMLEAARVGPTQFVPLLPDAIIALTLAAAVLRWRVVTALAVAQVAGITLLYAAEAQGLLSTGPPMSTARIAAYAIAVLSVMGPLLTMSGWTFRRTLAEQQASENRYRDLLERLPDGVLTYDSSGVVQSCNPAAATILGRPAAQMVGMHFSDVTGLDDRRAAVEAFQQMVDAGGADGLSQVSVVRMDGTLAVVEANPTIVRQADRDEVRVVIRDVTARLKAEERRLELEQQLLDARKLESVGRLAGGVAHDFNNLLTVIIAGADLLREEPLGAEATILVDEVARAADRAADVTGQLLAFARRQVREPKAIELSGVVARAETLLRRLAREDIELQTTLAAVPLPVYADPVQLEQVLVNLVVNARDAMPEGGRLTLETGAVDLSDDYVSDKAGVQPGPYALLAVTDNGQGMDPDTQAHIFEPFYSTKGDNGTGLGLATVHGIVKQSGGHVFVYSEPGRGTTFKVYLPITNTELAEPDPVTANPEPRSRSAAVLVVDDDPAVLSTVVRILQRHGCEVLQALGPHEAIAVSQAHKGRVDLLLTDVVMPKMGGRELARHLCVGRPGLKVLYTSGYTENAIVHHGVLDNDIDFLPKPFTSKALCAKVDALVT